MIFKESGVNWIVGVKRITFNVSAGDIARAILLSESKSSQFMNGGSETNLSKWEVEWALDNELYYYGRSRIDYRKVVEERVNLEHFGFSSYDELESEAIRRVKLVFPKLRGF